MRKCIIRGCANFKGEGNFVRNICACCHKELDQIARSQKYSRAGIMIQNAATYIIEANKEAPALVPEMLDI